MTDTRTTTPYRLPNGWIVGIFEDVARGAQAVSFEMHGGEIVDATLISEHEAAQHAQRMRTAAALDFHHGGEEH